MFNRALALFVAVSIALGTIIPFTTPHAQAESRPRQHRHRHAKHYKKYSKAWWRQYRARVRHRRAIAAARRALRLRQLRLAKAHEEEKAAAAQGKPVDKSVSSVFKKAPASTPVASESNKVQPGEWKGAQPPADLQFRVNNPAGDQIGTAQISVVGPAALNHVEGGRGRSVGGVPTARLRGDVIDKMIKENGWVVNDYQKEIGGQNVYVVIAQSQAKNGGVESRMYYFTEVDGMIYSVMTNSPVQEAEHLAEESDKVINSLKTRVRPTQRASVKP